MCGIAGTMGFLPDESARELSVESLMHRGPDATGHWINAEETVWFGHRRLSILGPGPSGDQPMLHPDRPDIAITYNGEIYNYRELKKILEASGCRFRTGCDTEMLLHAYTTWGTSLLDRIEGMFAFAIHDGSKSSLFLARDPVGQKPLYFTRNSHGCAFASTPDAIRILDPTIDRLSPLGLRYILTIGYVPSPHSIWHDVEVLPPGHMAEWTRERGLQIRRYWAPPERLDGESSAAEFSQLFSTVCAGHTISDVPIGLFLSSGLDSTSIALALVNAGIKLNAYCFGVTGDPRSETVVAEQTARRLGLNLKVREFPRTDFNELFERVSRAAPEPQALTGQLPIYQIAELASSEVKTVLSGDGGDELFGGYPWYRTPDFNLLRWLRARIPRSFAIGPDKHGVASPLSFEKFARQSTLHAHAQRIFRGFLPSEANALLRDLPCEFDEDAMLAPFREHFVSSLPLQSALQRVDLMTFCSSSILTKVDHMSMAHSLEVRSPFLDRRMIDWAMSRKFAPAEPGEEKRVLREFLRGNVPDSVLTQKKIGFGMRGVGRAEIDGLEARIERSSLTSDGLLSTNFSAFIAPHSANRGRRIWALAALSSWYDHHKFARRRDHPITVA